MTIRMLGVADIARMFGVKSTTVSMWLQRYADFPTPDVTVSGRPGWAASRAAEIRSWESARPGKGRRR